MADDSDIFISLLWATSSFKSAVFFQQEKSSYKEVILYTEIYPLAEQLGEDVCEAVPAFLVLSGSNYTSSFFGKTKYTCIKKMIVHPESCSLLKSLNHASANIGEVIELVLWTVHNHPKSEKTLGDTQCNMLFIKSKNKNKFASTKSLPPDEISLALKIKRDNYISPFPTLAAWIQYLFHHLQLATDGNMTTDICHQYGLKVLPYLWSENMHKMFQSHLLQMNTLKF